MDPDGGAADGREQADLRRAQDRAGFQGEIPGLDVAAARADVGAGLDGAVHPDLAARALGRGAAGRMEVAAPPPVPPSVHSTGTTASAPGGSGAPVMIRAAWPGPTRGSESPPAATSPMTVRTAGNSSSAPDTSAVRTA